MPREVLGLFTPGSHGSSFGGNPPECTVAAEALAREGVLCKASHEAVIHLAPPLVVTRGALAWGMERGRRLLG